jgi:hypothetical protein
VLELACQLEIQVFTVKLQQAAFLNIKKESITRSEKSELETSSKAIQK